MCGNGWIIDDAVDEGGSIFDADECFCDVDVFADVGRTTTGTIGVDETAVVVVVVVGIFDVVVFDGVERR